MEEFILGLITSLVGSHPLFAGFLMVVGILRTVMKPLFVILHKITEQTPTKSDDKLLAEVEKSKVMEVINFLLDYFASVKLKK